MEHYGRRFTKRFFKDAAWGRDQLIGALVIVAVLAYQIYSGDITVSAAKAEVSKWSVLTPHLIIIGIYVVVHAALTASRMDKEWEQAAGLPVDLFAFINDQDNMLRLLVRNRGGRDVLSGEIRSIQGCVEQVMMDTYPARWMQNETESIAIGRHDDRTLKLALVPEMGRDDNGNSKAPAITFYTVPNDVVVRPRMTTGVELYFNVRIKSEKTGLQKSQDMRIVLGRVDRNVFFESHLDAITP